MALFARTMDPCEYGVSKVDLTTPSTFVEENVSDDVDKNEKQEEDEKPCSINPSYVRKHS